MVVLTKDQMSMIELKEYFMRHMEKLKLTNDENTQVEIVDGHEIS